MGPIFSNHEKDSHLLKLLCEIHSGIISFIDVLIYYPTE